MISHLCPPSVGSGGTEKLQGGVNGRTTKKPIQ